MSPKAASSFDRTLPRDARADAYDLPRFPLGWYAPVRSSELRSGKPMSLHYFGRSLVAFRDEHGQARLLDAFCPHYGADLGVGGKVVDGTIECPFHGWRFDGSGSCVDAPFTDRPPRASIAAYPVREHDGLVFVWFGSAPPSFEPPRIPEANDRRQAFPISSRHVTRNHIQEMRENIVDTSHFQHIHGQQRPMEIDFVPDGAFAQARGALRKRVLGVTFDQSFVADMYGPGIMLARSKGRHMRTLTVALTTPIDEVSSEMRLLHYVWSPYGKAISLLEREVFVLAAYPEIRREERIWDAKTYKAKPILLPHESILRQFRQWYAQFYADDTTDTTVIDMPSEGTPVDLAGRLGARPPDHRIVATIGSS